MGKPSNHTNPRNTAQAPVDGPCEKGGAAGWGGPGFAQPVTDGPCEAGMPTGNATPKTPGAVEVDGPNNKEGTQAGRDSTPRY